MSFGAIVILGLAGVANFQVPDRLNIEEAMMIAERNAFSLRIASSEVEKARGNLKTARGAFLPSVTLSAGLTRQEAGGSSRNTSQALVNLNQPIDISGLSRAALQATEFNLRAAEAAYEAEATIVRDRTRQAFHTLLLTEALVGVSDRALEASQARFARAKVRETEGAVARFDVLRFENEVAKAFEAQIGARGDRDRARQSLNLSLSRPIETMVEVVAIDGLPTIPRDTDSLVTFALKNRFELKQAEYIAESLGRVAKTEERGLKPSLALVATHVRLAESSQFQPRSATSGGLEISWPIWDSGITKGRVQAARQNEVQARIRLEQQMLLVALEVRSAVSRYQTALATYVSSQNSERLAAESLRLAQLRYDEQAGIQLDVITAQADDTAAKGAVETSKYAALNAYSALVLALGSEIP